MSSIIQYRITVKGRVQGVGYRYSALREANLLGIKGIVKNLSDGSVYIEAEGPKEILDLFTDWCRKGPGLGHVSSVNVSEYPVAGYSDFQIVR